MKDDTITINPSIGNYDWFNVMPEPVKIKNPNLIDIIKPIEVHTCSECHKFPDYNIKPTIPHHNFVCGAWSHRFVE